MVRAFRIAALIVLTAAQLGCPSEKERAPPSPVSAAETGYPGMPMTGLPCTTARMTGLPGLMLTP